MKRVKFGFPGISRRTHGGNGLKFCMLMYPDHLQNWLYYGYSLLIFVILMLFWPSEMGQIWGFAVFRSCSVDFPHYGDPLAEIGHIWGCWALSGERVGVNVGGGGGGGRHILTLCVEFRLVYTWNGSVRKDVLQWNNCMCTCGLIIFYSPFCMYSQFWLVSYSII